MPDSFLQALIPDSNRLDLAFARGPAATRLIEESYDGGFVGAFIDDTDQPSWARSAARYLRDEFFADTPGTKKRFSDMAPSLANGDGECHMNCRYALEFWLNSGRQGVKPYSCYQDYGSCVDASATEHMTSIFGWRAARPEFNEEYKFPAAWYWYAARGYCSDGWNGSGIATQARRHGVAFRTKYDLPGGSVDFTDDDKNEQIVARQWCRSGIPAWLHDHTSKNHAFEDGAITAFDDGGKAELKKCFAAGGALHHSGTRTSGGSRPFTIGSTGAHMQSAVGYDDSDEFRRFCQDVIGVKARDDDFPVVSHQTWGSGWRGECADQYWPSWWGPKPEGAWVWWASDLLRMISCDYVWLPLVKGFAKSGPPPAPNPPKITGALFAEQFPGGIAIRGEIELDGKHKYIVVPDGTGKYTTIPKPLI